MSVVSEVDVFLLFSIFSGNVLTTDELTELDHLFSEVILKLGHDPRAWISQIATTDTGTEADTADRESYELRESLGLIRLLALFVDDRQLTHEEENALPPRWRDRVGDPIAYVTEAKNDRLVRFFPKPDRTIEDKPFNDPQGAPTVIYTERRGVGIPAQLLMPITMLLLAREFERESSHRDQDFSSICQALGDTMLNKLQHDG